MLTWSFVLQRIKEEYALPFQHFEKTDEEIIDYGKRNVVKKYSTYFPQKWRMTLNTSDPDIQVVGRKSEFYVVDPDDREIFGITEFIPTLGDSAILGHEIIGAYSYDELPSKLLNNWKANNTKIWSDYNYVTEFIPPNQLRITPSYVGKMATLEYQRSHDPELSTIMTHHHDLFIDLMFGMVGQMIGRIRKKYTPIQTPFGEIQLNADDIFSEAKEVYDKTMETLVNGSLPSVIFDHG
jgi:hypothetical protein